MECFDGETCERSAHLDGEFETLNSLPVEWVVELLGCRTLNRNIIIWRDEAGKLHNENGPAAEYPNGMREWWIHGEKHRVGGPATIDYYGNKQWRQKGILHRVDGPAVERVDGTKEWWVNGSRHRVGGPAVEEADGTREWYYHGERHHEDGSPYP